MTYSGAAIMSAVHVRLHRWGANPPATERFVLRWPEVNYLVITLGADSNSKYHIDTDA